MRPPTVGKKKRKVMLERQANHCACCKVYLPNTSHARHDTATNRMLCPSCMLLASSVRASLERGVTFDIVSNYLKLPSLELPDVVSKLTAKEKRAAGRAAVEAGQVMVPDGNGGLRPKTLTEYNNQFGGDEDV